MLWLWFKLMNVLNYLATINLRRVGTSHKWK